jgi:histidine phosphotransferase ChpT
MNEISALQLTQLLITKLCHDIVGPIGAINNGVEFLQEAGGMEKQAIALIADSSSQAIARIQFYRYLYGLMKEQEVVSLDDKQALCESFYQSSKVKLHWHEVLNEKLPNITPEDLRIICNLILIAGGSLMRGGDVCINYSGENVIEVKAKGSQAVLHDELQDILRNEGEHVPNATNVQVIYTKMLIVKQGGNVRLTLDGESLELHYMLKNKGG